MIHAVLSHAACRGFARHLVVCLLWGLSNLAHAQLSGAGPVSSTTADSFARFDYLGTAGAYPGNSIRTNTQTSTGITVTDKVGFNGPIGAIGTAAGATVARSIPWAVAGRAIASGVATCGGVPTCIAAPLMITAAAIAIDQYRMRHPSATDHPERQGIQWDPGQDAVQQTRRCYTQTTYLTGLCVSSRDAVFAAVASQIMSGGYWNTLLYEAGPTDLNGGLGCNAANLNNCAYATLHFERVVGGNVLDNQYTVVYVSTGADYTQSQCPAYVDPFNNIGNVPAGQPVGPDGKCRSGLYTQSNLDEAQAFIAAHPPDAATKQKIYDGFDNWLRTMGPCTDCPADSPMSVTLPSPSTVTAPPVTSITTTPTAQTTTTTTNSYPMSAATSLSPANNRYGIIRWGTTTTKTETLQQLDASGNPTGTPVTSTTSTTIAAPSGDAVATTSAATLAAQAEAVTQCDKFPESSGCAKLGDVPAPPAALVPQSHTVELTPVTFAGGACPSASSFTAFGHSYTMSFDAMCSAASTWMRGVVLVSSFALAAWIFVGGLKS